MLRCSKVGSGKSGLAWKFYSVRPRKEGPHQGQCPLVVVWLLNKKIIKRAKQGSMQGGSEFKNEVELLSRVHHKNLVGLIGFCFEQEEQMLVYEYVPNGTLGESLYGKSGIRLD